MSIILLFLFLTTSLFLGDGKQPFVDAWWALGILMMYGVRYYQRGKLDLRPLPRFIGWAWTALILYYVILIPFSDSAGYSITATIRLIEGYLIYMMFATISSEKTTALFTKGLLFVGVVATLASFVFLLVPAWASVLPSMNLLFATYGHNHLADLLLMIFPIVITQSSWLLLIFFTIGMFFTFARGAWLLLVFYLLFLVRRSKNTTVRRAGLFVAAATTAAFLLVSLGTLRGIPQKPSLVEDGRWEYWRQAVEAIKERPFFGSGPGTFSLESKRLQSAPNSWSWFAHSFPLETTVEVGIVGAILLLFVFIASLLHVRASPLFALLLLTLLYSFFEFNLNYTTVWLLFWGTLGLSFNDKRSNRQENWGSSGLAAGGLIVLCLFYTTNTLSAVLDVVGNKKLAFFVAPYIVPTTKNYLEQIGRDNQKISSAEERTVLWFYKKDPDILFALGKTFENVEEIAFTQILFEEAELYDPFNDTYVLRRVHGIIQRASSLDKVDKLIDLLIVHPSFKVSDREAASWKDMIDFQMIPRDRLDVALSDFSRDADNAMAMPDASAKLLYALGFEFFQQKQYRFTYILWRLAVSATRFNELFYVELANLYKFFGEPENAKRILQSCLHMFNGDGCRYYYNGETYVRQLASPGSFAPHILEGHR